MAAAVSLSLNGCTEIENLLAFCKIPKERVRIEESGHAPSSKVWILFFSFFLAPAVWLKIKIVPLSCRN